MCSRYNIDEDIFYEVNKLVKSNSILTLPQKDIDIYPSQSAPIIAEKEGNLFSFEMEWGIPWKTNRRIINARAESAMDKRIFNECILFRRCVIPMKKFYEWDKQKNRAAFSHCYNIPLYVAGFFDMSQGTEHFVILTTQANASVSPIHNRMPLIIDVNDIENWIKNKNSIKSILNFKPGLLEIEKDYDQISLFD